ncbi:SapC family protein [Shewanella abyssi]|uniref:SapC family protein n=1 Tax=Shewanella abyssi TaxID=311789 RepID=UPI00200DAE5D|nr:SapC family protein [Shewanella abyssi]MCL1051249.1 SapC family protein [Shewanella abyssi]
MEAKYVALNNNEHKDVRIKDVQNFEEFSKEHMAPLMVQEFMPAAASFPIIFTKDPNSNVFKAVALFALKPETNQFVKQGKWTARYVPMVLRGQPFIARENEQQSVMIGFNSNSALVNTTEGHRLFDDNGEQTDYLKQQVSFMGKLAECHHITAHFIKQLTDNELLQQKVLTIKGTDGKDHKIQGIYTVDEERLKNLADDKLLMFAKQGVFGPIYAHLSSLGQVDLLMK